MNKLVATVAASAALVFATATFATEVENQDSTDRTVVYSVGEGGPVTVTLKAGEKKRLCEEGCNLMIEDSNFEATSEADDVVIIKDGKLMIKPRS